MRERSREILFITVSLFVFSMLGVGAYSFLNRGDSNTQQELAYSQLGLLNGEPIDAYYYNRQFNQLFSSVPAEQRMVLDPDIIDYYRYQSFQETVSHMLMLKEAKEEGIKAFPQEFNYRMDQIVKAYGLTSMGKFKKLLKENNVEWKDFKEQQKNEIMVSKFLNGITSRVRVTPIDRKLAFTEIKARHILIKVDNTTENMEEDLKKLKKAESIYEMILSNKKNFAAIAEKYSEDTASAKKGGDLGWISRGQMVPEFEKMLYKLMPGEIGGPIKTMFGYHILLVEEKREKDIPVNITDEQIDQQILQQKQQEAVQKWLQPLKASADIEIIDPQVNAYDYRMQQKYEEALFEYKKALMEKNDLLLYVQIARMQDKIGNVDEGKRSLRKALILQKRLSGYRYPMLYFAAIDFFIKYKDRDLYRGLFDDVLATFKGNKVIMDIADNNYRDNMTKTQRANLDEQLALIAEQEAQTESEKQSVQNNPLSALDKLDTLTGNSLVE